MEVDPFAAAVAGLIAAQCMEVPAYVQRALRVGVRQDIFAEAGAIMRVRGPYRRVAGWFGHALLAVVIVLLYSTFFLAVGNDHLVWWGMVAGGIHGALGGMVVGAWTDLHPDIPRSLPAPGVFYRHYGRRDVLTFCIGHLVFGIVSAAVYVFLHPDLSAAALL